VHSPSSRPDERLLSSRIGVFPGETDIASRGELP